MNARLQRPTRWALSVSGVLGLVCAASMIPVALNYDAKLGATVSFYAGLPNWAQWGAVPPTAYEMLVVGALCALLLVCGRWPARVCAALGGVWFVYAEVAFGPGSRWELQLQQAFTMTPYLVAAVVSAVVLLALSILALVMAALAPGSVRDVAGQPGS